MMFNKFFIITAISLIILAPLEQQALGYGAPPVQSSAGNYTIEMNFDKESHNLGESITISGNVSKYDKERDLRISIFDSSNNLILTQKISVNIDTSFSHTLSLDEKFHEGKYTVKSQYGSSKTTVKISSFVINSNNALKEQSLTNSKIPDWIKNNAGWWANDEIDDATFVRGLQYMVQNGIIHV